MKKYSIRKAKLQDNQVLAQTIRAVFEEFDAPKEGTVYSDPTTDQLYELFRQQGAELWVGELQGKVVGCCGIYPTDGLDERCVELVKFYLSREARGLGLGKQLMLTCIEAAKRLGYQQVYLESIPEYSKAVGMYEQLGFRELDAPLGQSGHHGCNIWMLLEL